MCRLHQNTTEALPTLPTLLTQIVGKYRLITGVPCEVYIVDKSTSFACTNTYRSGYNHFCNEYPCMVPEILRFYSLHLRPYIFSCHDQFYHWLFLKETSDADYLFVCGPVRTVEHTIEIVRKAQKPPCESLPVSLEAIQKLPYINKKILPAYSNLLLDMIAIHMSDSQGAADINIPTAHTETLSHNRTNKANTDKTYQHVSKSEQVKINDCVKDNVRKILKCAITGDRVEAIACWDNNILEINKQQELQSAISSAIGIFSLFGQAINDSMHFSFTRNMFSIYSDFLQTINTKTSINEVILCTRLYFISYWNEMLSDTAKYGSNGIATHVMNYIIANYHRSDLSIEHISDALNVSQSYLCRTFKKSSGFTVKRYITTHRITVATEMLRGTSCSISDIAEQTGFFTAQAFRKAFREYYHISPSQFKSLCKVT